MLTAAYLLKSQDIVFASQKEIAESLTYLNELRHSKDLVKQETGIEVESVNKKTLTIDSNLQELAKLRVIEMIKGNHIGHNTIYDTDYYSECTAYNYNGSIKSHIKLYIVDEGVIGFGHRKALINEYNKKAGIAAGMINGKSFSCILLSDGIYETYIALKEK